MTLTLFLERYPPYIVLPGQPHTTCANGISFLPLVDIYSLFCIITFSLSRCAGKLTGRATWLIKIWLDSFLVCSILEPLVSIFEALKHLFTDNLPSTLIAENRFSQLHNIFPCQLSICLFFTLHFVFCRFKIIAEQGM